MKNCELHNRAHKICKEASKKWEDGLKVWNEKKQKFNEHFLWEPVAQQIIDSNVKILPPNTSTIEAVYELLSQGEVCMVMFVISNGDEGGVYDVAITNEIGKSIDIKEQDNYELAKFDITTLKPFDKVLVRDSDEDMWCASIFSHTWKDKYFCVGAWHNQCIPYEGNEQLLGKTDDCDDYYKTWK